MTRPVVLSWLVGVGALSITLSAHQAQQAQQKAPPPLPELTRVKDNLYIIGSSAVDASFTGGNTGVFVMENGGRRFSSESGQSHRSRSRRSSTLIRTAIIRAAIPDFPRRSIS